MRLSLVLLVAISVSPVRAEDKSLPDPLVALVSAYAAPQDHEAADAPGAPPQERGERLARVQSDLTAAAVGLEVMRAPAHAEALKTLAMRDASPELRKFFKDRDVTLDTIYRTLALVDYTWALRFPEPPCSPGDKRKALLESRDGLFADPDVGSPSPWLAGLLGSVPFGRSSEEALDMASAESKLTARAYEQARVRVSAIGDELTSATGAERSKLYCERAGLYEELAKAHRSERMIEAGLSVPGADAAQSVLLLAARDGKNYRALGAGFLVKTAGGVRVLTDASLTRGQDALFAFTKPADGQPLGEPWALTVVRSAPDSGPALARLEGSPDLPALELAKTVPFLGDLARGIGHVDAAGAWTTTQGLVTAVGAGTFRTDALVSEDQLGGPILNERGEVAGLVVRAGDWAAVISSGKLSEFVASGSYELDSAPVSAVRNTGSAAILTAVRPLDLRTLEAPGGGAIESGLPGTVGGVDWDNGGGGLGNFRPTGSAGPPAMDTPPSAPAPVQGYVIAPTGGGSLPPSSPFYTTYRAPSGGAGLPNPGWVLIGDLFKGAYKGVTGLFGLLGKGLEAIMPDQTTVKRAAPPKKKEPEKKKEIEPKITGLVLSADPPDVAPGQSVRLVAQLQFQGDYKPKGGISISFTGGGGAAYFGDAERRRTSDIQRTDGMGRATATLILDESVAMNSENEFEDLDHEKRVRDGEEAPAVGVPEVADNDTTKGRFGSELDSLDSEAVAAHQDTAAKAQSPGIQEAATPIKAAGVALPTASVQPSITIQLTANGAGFFGSAKITPHTANGPQRQLDCIEILKRLFPRQQATQLQYQNDYAGVSGILSKYDIDYDIFRAKFPELLFLGPKDECKSGEMLCALRSNPSDWPLVQAAYGQVQAMEKSLQVSSVAIGKLHELCALPGKPRRKKDENENQDENNSRNRDERKSKDSSAGGSEGEPDANKKKIFGENGVQVTSKTLWRGEGQERLDVENPNPGQRPGQIHYQDNDGNKFLYDPASKSFPGAPNSVNELLEDPRFANAIQRALHDYLGE
jgi:hypothetical protein